MKSTQTFYLPEAVNLISQNLGYQFPIESLYHEAEQGHIAIGFINNDDGDQQSLYFLDIENIQELNPADQNKAECTASFIYFTEEEAQLANMALHQGTPIPEHLNSTDRQEILTVYRDKLVVRKSELEKYIQHRVNESKLSILIDKNDAVPGMSEPNTSPDATNENNSAPGTRWDELYMLIHQIVETHNVKKTSKIIEYIRLDTTGVIASVENGNIRWYTKEGSISNTSTKSISRRVKKVLEQF